MITVELHADTPPHEPDGPEEGLDPAVEDVEEGPLTLLLLLLLLPLVVPMLLRMLSHLLEG